MLNMRAQEYILSSDSKFVHADQHPKDSFAAEKAGGDRHGGVRPSAVRSFYHHEALSEGHQPPWLLFLGWYMYQRKIYFQKKKRRAVAPKIL